MWKFHDFSITQILRGINFGDSRSAKSANFTNSEALNFDIYAFLHYLKDGFYQIDQIQKPKTAVLELPESLKLISHKI